MHGRGLLLWCIFQCMSSVMFSSLGRHQMTRKIKSMHSISQSELQNECKSNFQCMMRPNSTIQTSPVEEQVPVSDKYPLITLTLVPIMNKIMHEFTFCAALTMLLKLPSKHLSFSYYQGENFLLGECVICFSDQHYLIRRIKMFKIKMLNI